MKSLSLTLTLTLTAPLLATAVALASCSPAAGSLDVTSASIGPGVTVDAPTRPNLARLTMPVPIEGQVYAWSALDLLGRRLGPEALSGKVVVLDFWASWCPACVYGLPKLKALYEEFHDDGLEIVGMSFDSDPTELAAYAEDAGLGWSQVFVGREREAVVEATGVGAIPRYFVIDREGVLISTDAATHELPDLVKGLLGADA